MVIGVTVALIMLLTAVGVWLYDVLERHHIHIKHVDCDYCRNVKGARK